MNESKYYLAVDIGASSGRHIVAHEEGGEIVLDEVYRFPNSPKEVDGHLTWDIKSILMEVKNGIAKCLLKYPHIESMSIDTWGVDYVLLDENDEEIYPVYNYRDYRTKAAVEKVHSIIPFSELYSITGCGFNEFNTVYQFMADLTAGRLEKASSYLMIPEYLMYKLTGVKKNEYTNASTTGMLNAISNDFDASIVERLGYPRKLFKGLSKPGTLLGEFTQKVQSEVHGNIKVVLCPTHDTGAAVEGIPMEGNSPYISSGTWSLLGIKSPVAVTSETARLANYSNEYGPDYIRLQKNIMGLWIIQGLAKQCGLSFPEMVNLARASKFEETFDVNDNVFLSSLDMTKTIQEWYRSHDKEVPLDLGDLINATYKSLALSYKVAIDELEKITGKTYPALYIVGGGAKNAYLNELTEKYTGKKVVALPIEATSLGNIKSQMKGN